MMKKLFFSVVYLLLIMPFYGYGMGKDNESDWNRLISEGSNYIVRATSTVTIDGRKFQHFASLNEQKATNEMKKWFSDFVAYSIPTNDMVRYADMLRVKTMLLYLTAWRMDSRKSWDELAKFLADVKSKKLPKSSERREELRKQFRMENGSLDIGPYREQLHKESCYQSALNQTELKITRAFYHILRNLPKEREGELIPILSEVLGADFVMQLKEMVGKK
jgi:hypothetical protein